MNATGNPTPRRRNCRRAVLLALAVAALAAGCKTVGPREFLYHYRRAYSPKFTPEDYRAIYDGKQDGYHVMRLRHRHPGPSMNPNSVAMQSSFHDEYIRCPVHELPQTFPKDFQTLYDYDWMGTPPDDWRESPAATRRYVETYLKSHGKWPGDEEDR